MAKNEEISYSDALAELEAILKKFDDGSADVDTLAAQVARATELITVCKKRLKKAEDDVNKILGEEA